MVFGIACEQWATSRNSTSTAKPLVRKITDLRAFARWPTAVATVEPLRIRSLVSSKTNDPNGIASRIVAFSPVCQRWMVPRILWPR